MTDRTSASIHPLFFNRVPIQTPGGLIRAGHFCTTPFAERRLDEILEPHGRTGQSLLGCLGAEVWRKGERAPWATIVLPRPYPLTGHFLTLREGPEQLSLSTFELEPCQAGEYAEVGILTFSRKRGLFELADQCPFLGAAWQALEHLAESMSFLVCAPEPHPVWLEMQAARDQGLHDLAKALERMRSSMQRLIGPMRGDEGDRG